MSRQEWEANWFYAVFIGVGMVLGILITENFIVIAMAVICLLCGYHMFCR